MSTDNTLPSAWSSWNGDSSSSWKSKSSDSSWSRKGKSGSSGSGNLFQTIGHFIEYSAVSIVNFLNRRKFYVFTVVVLVLLSLFTSVPLLPHYKWGSGKYVIILAANPGGGVMQWKGAKEWSIERSSIANKKAYAARHGYHLAIKDMAAKKRYAHEWRESWEKVDIIKQTMRQFPDAEWFWWLDLHTYIMEPQVSLDQKIFRQLENKAFHNVSYFNPLNISVNIPYVDYNQPIDLIITQDCGGFNLGSFFIRRSEWSEKLLDVMWDPVFYEQKHMEWEHKEQDALEYFYTNEAWIRGRIAFMPLRAFNAFPQGACPDMADDPSLFYNQHDRDFVVNMAGCEWGRDCWGEMEHFKTLSRKLHRRRFPFFWR